MILTSVDSETNGIDIYHGAAAFLVTWCELGQPAQYLEWDVDPYTRRVKIPNEDREFLWELFNSPDRLWCGQNLKFDVTCFRRLFPRLKWPWDRTHDTLTAGHLLFSPPPHDLTTMVLRYCGVDLSPLEKRLEKAVKECRTLVRTNAFRKEYGEWRIANEGLPEMPSAKEKTWRYDYWLPRAVATAQQLPVDHHYWTVLSEYACGDSTSTVHLWHEMEQLIRKKQLWKVYEKRNEQSRIIQDMECSGIAMCVSRTAEIREQFTEVAERCLQENVALAEGEIEALPVNGRSKALDHVVFNKFGLKTDRKTDTGKMAMDKYVLEDWIAELDQQCPAYKFIWNLRDYRKRKTALGYQNSYEKYGLKIKGVDDFLLLHPSVNLTGTRTLRTSSYGPNEQQISKQDEVNLRYCFGPLPGREWWSLDASNIELRIPAYESGEKELIELFERPDDPPYYGSNHLLNFHTVYPDIWDDAVNKVGWDKAGPWIKKTYKATWYQWCKNGDFAVQYGAILRELADVEGTADKAFHRRGSHARLKQRFSRLEVLNQEQIDFANRCGYVETIPDVSVDPERGYPLWCTRTSQGILPTVPLNYHTQGTACWWMGMAMIRVDEFLRTEFPQGRIAMNVHDELVLDFPKGKGLRPERTNLPIIRKIQAIMSKGGEHIGVPTPVNAEWHGDNWATGISV